MDAGVGAGIEFVVEQDEPSASAAPEPGLGRRERWAVGALWFLAAALAAVSVGQSLFGYRYRIGVLDVHGSWTPSGDGSGVLTTGHGPAFSVAIWVCAAAFAGIALACVRGMSRVGTQIAGLAAAATLLGVGSGVVLWMISSIDGAHSVADALSGSGGVGSGNGVEVALGPAVFLLGAALVCALAALATPIVLARQAAAGDTSPPSS